LYSSRLIAFQAFSLAVFSKALYNETGSRTLLLVAWKSRCKSRRVGIKLLFSSGKNLPHPTRYGNIFLRFNYHNYTKFPRFNSFPRFPRFYSLPVKALQNGLFGFIVFSVRASKSWRSSCKNWGLYARTFIKGTFTF